MTPKRLTRDDILELFRRRGDLAYEGEGVSQLDHAWQCDQLAVAARAPASLRLACWLHDLGHLMTGLNGSPTLEGIDDEHEHLAEAALQPLFGAAVSRPVALHVQAKRVLVSRHPGYAARLSADSRRSLALQGGPMDPADCDRFDQDPHAASALRLRLWDDAAKRPDRGPPSVAAALATLDGLMQRVQPTG